MSRRDLSTRPPDRRPRTPEEDTVNALSWIKELIRQGQLTWNLFWDPRVPWLTKLIPPAVLVYLLSPIDIIPDLAPPGLGQLDDLAVILLGFKLFIDLAPAEVVREHLRKLGTQIEEWREDVIEGEYEVEDRDGGR